MTVNEPLVEEFHKRVIKKFKGRKVYARLTGDITIADLAEMESLSLEDKIAKYVLFHRCFSTNVRGLNLLKYRKGKAVLNAFIERVIESNRKQNKLWFDRGKKFYNKLIQEWLDNNLFLMFSTHNKGKSVIAEWFIKTSKAKIYKKNDS